MLHMKKRKSKIDFVMELVVADHRNLIAGERGSHEALLLLDTVPSTVMDTDRYDLFSFRPARKDGRSENGF